MPLNGTVECRESIAASSCRNFRDNAWTIRQQQQEKAHDEKVEYILCPCNGAFSAVIVYIAIAARLL